MDDANSNATLHLVCGKMAAGKSTYSKQLAQSKSLIYLSEDDLLADLFQGEIKDVASYIEKSRKLKLALKPVILQMLEHGNSLILDFPANTVAQRSWLLGVALEAKAHHVLHFIDLPDSICKEQLLKRASEHPERAATDTPEMFEAITKFFEPPTKEESLNVHRINVR